jgi:tryptophan-rich sensory protein
MTPAYEWYSKLFKPAWAPPSFLFGPVWSILYIIIVLSFGSVFKMWWQRNIGLIAILPFILNIVFNLLFTPLQFGLKNNLLAMIDIFLVFITLIWAIVVIAPVKKWIALAQIPYLLWVSFATVLQVTVTWLNR